MFQIKEQYPVLKPEVLSPVKTISGDIVFMIQIATSSSRTEIKPENFNGLTDVAEIKTEERFKYVCGNFDNYLSAVKYREKLESLYPGAFVIAVRDNKILPLQQAMEQIKQK
jgi:hypothetical protein